MPTDMEKDQTADGSFFLPLSSYENSMMVFFIMMTIAALIVSVCSRRFLAPLGNAAGPDRWM